MYTSRFCVNNCVSPMSNTAERSKSISLQNTDEILDASDSNNSRLFVTRESAEVYANVQGPSGKRQHMLDDFGSDYIRLTSNKPSKLLELHRTKKSLEGTAQTSLNSFKLETVKVPEQVDVAQTKVSKVKPSLFVLRHVDDAANASVGRLQKKRMLLARQRAYVDAASTFALFGLLFAVAAGEVSAGETENENIDAVSILLSLATLTTGALLAVIVLLYHCEIQMLIVDSGVHDWSVVCSWSLFAQGITEILVCGICPLPRLGLFEFLHYSGSRITVPLRVVLTLPMFLRFYLICRLLVVHSKPFADCGARSIAALNKVEIGIAFSVKSIMRRHPFKAFAMMAIAILAANSWMLVQCERFHLTISFIVDDKCRYQPTPPLRFALQPSIIAKEYTNALWFTMETFATIGYGDIVPYTYLGRGLSILTGILGYGVGTAFVAISGKKLDLTHAEKRVNAFVKESKLLVQVFQNHTLLYHANELKILCALEKKCRGQSSSRNLASLQKRVFIEGSSSEAPPASKTSVSSNTRVSYYSLAKNYTAAYQIVTDGTCSFRRVRQEQRHHYDESDALLDIPKILQALRESVVKSYEAQSELVQQVAYISAQMDDLAVLAKKNRL